jgi:hypothetical protein
MRVGSLLGKLVVGSGLLTVGLVVNPVLVNAQDPWTMQVQDQLVQSAEAAGHHGMGLSHEPYTGTLYDGRYSTVDLTLRAGTSYLIVGACDNDCTDLDLKLFDENWYSIDSDTDADDRPIVSVRPARTATFHVRSIMANCNDSPCAIGLGVFSDE